MFRFGAIIAEVQIGVNLCWAAQCILFRVLGEICYRCLGRLAPAMPTVATKLVSNPSARGELSTFRFRLLFTENL